MPIDKMKHIELTDHYRHVLSHDLRACVRAIDGFSKILIQKDDSIDPTTKNKFLERIQSNALILEEQLLSLIEYNKHYNLEPNIEECDLKMVIAEVEASLNANDFSSKYEIDKEAMMKVDKQMLKFIVNELLKNAVRFANENRSLEVIWKLEINDELQILQFNDNGMGIDTSNFNKALDLFHTFKQSENEGMGIGLAIVNVYVLKHGGTIELEKNVNNGLGIKIKLPNN